MVEDDAMVRAHAVVVHHGRLDAGVVRLSKPCRRQELAAKLRLGLRKEG